jgi:flagellin-like protein
VRKVRKSKREMVRRSSGDRAATPVIAIILMIAIVVLLAAVVATFVTGLVGRTFSNPSVSILIEDAEAGASNITLVHLGKDGVSDAFAPTSPPSYFLDATSFENIEVRINGSIYEGWASLNRGEIAKPDFEVGNELELGLGWKLSTGDRITVVYVPSNQVVGWLEIK